MLIGKTQIEALIPHQGGMCLIDEVLDWGEERITCRAVSHRDPDNPMRSGGELSALCGVEYAAQAMAIHGRLSMQSERAKGGYLVSLREIVCRVARLDDVRGDLVIDALLVMRDNLRVMYSFSVSEQRSVLLEGRAAVVLEA